jgi:hypothetical protein
VLQVGAPDVLYCVAKTEVHGLRNVYALHTAWMLGVVRWVVYWVVHKSYIHRFLADKDCSTFRFLVVFQFALVDTVSLFQFAAA